MLEESTGRVSNPGSPEERNCCLRLRLTIKVNKIGVDRGVLAEQIIKCTKMV